MTTDPTRPNQLVTGHEWFMVDPGDLDVGQVTTVIAAGRAIAIARTEAGYGALDNR